MKKRRVLAVLTAIVTLAAASIPALSVGNPVVMAAEDSDIVLSGETVECLPNEEGRATWISEEGEIIKATVDPEDGEIELKVYDVTTKDSLNIIEGEENGVKNWGICVPVDAKIGDSYVFYLHVENTEQGVKAVSPITINIIEETLFNDIHMADGKDCLLPGETNQIEVGSTLVRWNSEEKHRDYYDAVEFVGTYQSEDEDIAVVDEDGLVTGVANGETNINVSGKVRFSVDGDELREKEIEGSVYVAVEGEESCIHEWDNGTVTKNADCKNDGEILYTCTKCKNATKTEKIPATGKHNYVGVVTKEATTTETGVKTYTCSVCGDSYTETLPKLAVTKAETKTPKTGDNSMVGVWMAAAAVACGTLVVISRRKNTKK